MNSSDNSNSTSKYSIKRVFIFISVILILILWRYSFLLFIPNLTSLPQLSKKQVSPLISKILFLPTDTNKKYGIIDSFTTLDELKIDTVEGHISDEAAYVFKSPYGWSRRFDNYYGGYIILAASSDYFLVTFVHASRWDPGSLVGPTILLNFQVNTSILKWKDLFVINRKTGAIFKHFRFEKGLEKAYYDSTSREFYLRADEYYFYLKVK